MIYVEKGRVGDHDFSAVYLGVGGGGGWKISPKVRQSIKGGHQKVLVCTSLDESVHNGSLFCCVYFLVTHFNENKKAFSTHTDSPQISKNCFFNSVFHLQRICTKVFNDCYTSGDEASLRWRTLYKVVIQLLKAKLVALCPLRVLHFFFASDGASSQSLSLSLSIPSLSLHHVSPTVTVSLAESSSGMGWFFIT